MRRVLTLLIAVAFAVAVYRYLVSTVGVESITGHPAPADAVWAFPAVLVALATLSALTVASASRHGLTRLQAVGLPELGPAARARMNGLIWFAVAWLCVEATAVAFAPTPLGAEGSAIALGGTIGYLTYRLHRSAIDHDAYRSFNLVALLLAASALAAMSATGTGEWWTINFSTLGTSDDFAAACFNVGIVVAGSGMALLATGLTRSLTEARFRARRGAVTAIRVVIASLGASLVGVGLVPIDTDTVLHNVFACAAAAMFAMLAIGARSLVRNLPLRFRILSAAFVTMEAAAAIAYDGLGLFNLTVFEIIAFTLVFAWLIALVVCTTTHVDTVTDASVHHMVPRRRLARPVRSRPLRRPAVSVRPSRSRASARPYDVANAARRGDDDLPSHPIVA